MECHRCREAVSAMADAQASPAEEAAAGHHLSQCPACRDIAERTARLTRRLRVRLALPCPDLVGSVLAAFEERVRGKPAVRPCCVPEHVVVWPVGSALCGCAPGCRCGCQNGGSCRCRIPAVG
ncbi:hypothetical protein CU254_19315 [Amycolatopsis sp. AA4]|nr:hypothetical protein CU254_19315 [Amycolatopsis sp. AA4]